MTDRFSTHSTGLESPASDGFAITPSDSVELAEITRALYVGNSGTLALKLASGADIVLTGVGGGALLPLRVRQIKATGTTATAIVGLV